MSFLKADKAAGKSVQFLGLVRYHDNCQFFLLVHIFKQGQHLLAKGFIQGGKRLVQQSNGLVA